MTMPACRIEIADELSQDLALRDIASHFMDRVESHRCQEMIIDFSGVNSMTRSFAHEYLTRKRASLKQIHEVNVPTNVLMMFNVIERSETKPRFEELRDAPVIII